MDLEKLDDSERASAVFNIGLVATVLASMVKKEKEYAPGDRDVESKFDKNVKEREDERKRKKPLG